MSARRQFCPHCKAALASKGPSEKSGHCPACGKPVNVGAVGTTAPAWYYARNQQPVGPLTGSQLKELAAASRLSPTDLVWRAGMKEWVAARTVKGLFPTPVARPAPVLPVAPVPAPAPCSVGSLAALFSSRHEVLADAQVVPEATRCVQCGICSYNCPMGIDVRAHAWRGKPVHDSHCLTCSECVNRCPRGVLRFERISLVTTK